MFICNECGYVSREKNATSCGNTNCRHHQKTPQASTFNLLNPNEMHRLFNSTTRHLETAKDNAPIHNHTPPKAVHQNLPCSKHTLGFATVPMQTFDGISSLDDAMKNGTLFPSLNMPYDKKIINRGPR